MIITETPTEVSGNLVAAETVAMSIAGEASALIIRTLTDLYSNTYMSVLREYTSNALDSHSRAGTTRPVEVSLPNSLSPSLIIQDWGVGLDRQGLRDYGQYGRTDKNSSNTEIGGFGLGSKSGLTIASQLTVQAVKDGFKNTMLMGFNDTGAPILEFLNAEPIKTDDPNGVKISIPTNERQRFASALATEMFIGWKVGSILIDGDAPEHSVHDPEFYRPIKDAGWVATVKAHKPFNYYHRNGTVIIGPVRYDLNWDEVPGISYGHQEGFFKDVVLNLPIGSVDLVPSREALRWTPRTRKMIQDVAQTMIEHAREHYREQVENAPSLREAVLLQDRAERFDFPSDYTWHGIPLAPSKPKGVTAWDNINHLTTVSSVYTKNSYTVKPSRQAVSQSQGSIRHADNLMKRAAGNDKMVLVTDAEYSYDEDGNVEAYHVGSRGHVLNYLRALKVDDDDLNTHEYEFVFLAYPEADLDPAFVGAFASTIKAETIIEKAEAHRKEVMRQARLNRKKVPKKSDGEMEARPVVFRVNGTSYFNTTTLGELDPEQKYILLVNDPDSDSTEMKVRRAIMTQTGSSDYPRIETLARHVNDKGYKFLLANKSWKVKAYPDFLPNLVTFSDVVDKITTEVVNSLTDVQIRAARDKQARGHSWVEYLRGAEHLIKADDTREWVEAMNSSKDATVKYKFIESVIEAIDQHPGLGLSKDKYKLADTDQQTSPGHRYPLLQSLYSNASAIDITHYMNLVDQNADRL